MTVDSFSLTVRASASDAHYAGNLCAGALILEWFGDAATGLLLVNDGDEGLFASYDDVQFKAPLYAGDFCRVTASLAQAGRRSRKLEFVCERLIHVIDGKPVPGTPSVIATGSGTCVVGSK